MNEDFTEREKHGMGEVRCFRCGRHYQADQVSIAQGDAYPAQFRGQPLCRICREIVKGKRDGWWAEPASV